MSTEPARRRGCCLLTLILLLTFLSVVFGIVMGLFRQIGGNVWHVLGTAGRAQARVSLQAHSLSEYDDKRIAISRDGSLVCYWESGSVSTGLAPKRWFVITSSGELVARGTADVPPDPVILEGFPHVPLGLWAAGPPAPGTIVATEGEPRTVRFAVLSPPEGPRSLADPDPWRVGRFPDPSKDKADWSVELASFRSPGFLAYVGGARPLLVVGFGGTRAEILDPASGRRIGGFFYGREETDSDGAVRKRRLGLRYPHGDPALKFSAYPFGVDSNRELVAAGSFFDARVRVVSLSPPHGLRAELNADLHPGRPFGGVWRVRDVGFSADGGHLVVTSVFSGKGTPLYLRRTDIFETATWRRVWSTSHSSVASVAVSGDSGRMVFLHGSSLVFLPVPWPVRQSD